MRYILVLFSLVICLTSPATMAEDKKDGAEEKDPPKIGETVDFIRKKVRDYGSFEVLQEYKTTDEPDFDKWYQIEVFQGYTGIDSCLLLVEQSRKFKTSFQTTSGYLLTVLFDIKASLSEMDPDKVTLESGECFSRIEKSRYPWTKYTSKPSECFGLWISAKEKKKVIQYTQTNNPGGKEIRWTRSVSPFFFTDGKVAKQVQKALKHLITLCQEEELF